MLVVEDAAEAHGAQYRGRRTGSLGDVAAFSFYLSKVVTTGEGGMVVTDNPSIAAAARSLRNQASTPGSRFVHSKLGFNYRMTNLQAAVGVAQVHRIEEIIRRKRDNAAYYRRLLGAIPGLRLPQKHHGQRPCSGRSPWWSRMTSGWTAMRSCRPLRGAASRHGHSSSRFTVSRYTHRCSPGSATAYRRAVARGLILPGPASLLPRSTSCRSGRRRAGEGPVTTSLRFGVVGCGRMGARRGQTVAEHPETMVVAVADVNRERATRIAASLGCQALDDEAVIRHPDIDTIFVCTPNRMHVEQAVAARTRRTASTSSARNRSRVHRPRQPRSSMLPTRTA